MFEIILNIQFVSTNSLELSKLNSFKYWLHITNISLVSRSKYFKLSHMSISTAMLILNDSDLDQVSFEKITPFLMKRQNVPSTWVVKFNLLNFLKFMKTVVCSY